MNLRGKKREFKMRGKTKMLFNKGRRNRQVRQINIQDSQPELSGGGGNSTVSIRPDKSGEGNLSGIGFPSARLNVAEKNIIKEIKIMKSLANKFAVLFTLLSFFTGTVFTQSNDLTAASGDNKGKGLYTTVLSIPVGTDIKYENDGLEEIEKIGPASFAVTSNGEFVIADTPTNRLVWFAPNGEKVNEITIEDAVGITDIKIKNGEIYALDASAVEPAVFRLNETGAVLEKIFVSADLRDEGLTGIGIGDGGELFFEMKDGASFVHGDGSRITEATSALASVKTQISAQEVSSTGSEAEFFVNDKKFEDILIVNHLGGLKPLAVTKNGDVFIAVSEVASIPTIYVDQTVRHYDANGNLLGIARVPISESYAYVQNGLTVTEQGDVFSLVARRKSLDIVKLNFKSRLEPILPVEAEFKESVEQPEVSNAACSISRDQIMANANAFLNNSVYLNNTNINGACSGRTKPRYLGSAGTKSSVPYDWGGFDSVSGFNSYMAQGYQAGDIPIYSTGVESCSKGVDCSGFVSRAFGTSTKYSTSTLPNISNTVTRENLQPGDIINRTNDHVVLFNTFEPNGITAWESTVNNNVDRVVKVFSSWTRLNNYTPRRYNNVCVGSFTLSASPITVTVSRGSTAFFNIHAYTNSGFRGAVNFYALNLPGQVLSGTGFTPTSVDVRNNSTWYGTTLRIVTNSSTPRGNFTITVEGRSGSGTVRTVVYLKVI